MTYQVIGEAAKSVDFQNRCRGAIISLGSDIIAATTPNAITNEAGEDITTQLCKDLAKSFCRGTNLFTLETAAMLMLLNGTIAANPSGIADGDIQFQTKQIWLTLVEIG